MSVTPTTSTSEFGVGVGNLLFAAYDRATRDDGTITNYSIAILKKKYSKDELVGTIESNASPIVDHLKLLVSHIVDTVDSRELDAFVKWNNTQCYDDDQSGTKVTVKNNNTRHEVIHAHLLVLLQWPVIWYEPFRSVISKLQTKPDLPKIETFRYTIEDMDKFKSEYGITFHASSCIRRMGYHELHHALATIMNSSDVYPWLNIAIKTSFLLALPSVPDPSATSSTILNITTTTVDDSTTTAVVNPALEVVAMSDTHGYMKKYHDMLKEDTAISPARILVHAGDMMYEESRSTHKDVKRILDAPIFVELNHLENIRKKVGASKAFFCGGNHDYLLEKFRRDLDVVSSKYSDIVYLSDDKPPMAIDIDGFTLHVWGTSFSYTTKPKSDGNFAFQKNADEAKKWLAEIKNRFARWASEGKCVVDIMVMHGPPIKCDELSKGGAEIGAFELALVEIVRPSLVICGHAHRADGRYTYPNTFSPYRYLFNDTTLVVNAAAVGIWNEPVDTPFMRIKIPMRSLKKCGVCGNFIMRHDFVSKNSKQPTKYDHLYCEVNGRAKFVKRNPRVESNIGQVVGVDVVSKEHFDKFSVPGYQGVAAFYAPGDRRNHKSRLTSHDVLLGYDYLGNFYPCTMSFKVLPTNPATSSTKTTLILDVWNVHSCAFWILEYKKDPNAKIPECIKWTDEHIEDAIKLIQKHRRGFSVNETETSDMKKKCEAHVSSGSKGSYQVFEQDFNALDKNPEFKTSEAAYHSARFWPMSKQWSKCDVNSVYDESRIFKRYYGESAFPAGNDNVIELMKSVLRVKFQQHHFTQKLVNTGDRYLIEVNSPDNGDNRWANRCTGDNLQDGGNWLGRCLMDVRSELKGNDKVVGLKEDNLVKRVSDFTSKVRLAFSFVEPGNNTESLNEPKLPYIRYCELKNVIYPKLADESEHTDSMKYTSDSNHDTTVETSYERVKTKWEPGKKYGNWVWHSSIPTIEESGWVFKDIWRTMYVLEKDPHRSVKVLKKP
jgi:predicted phosphodiesterase